MGSTRGAATRDPQRSPISTRQTPPGVAGGRREHVSGPAPPLHRYLGNRYVQEMSEPRAGVIPPMVQEVVRSPGQPLDPATRTFMESRFDADFGQVQVHTDRRAAESADAVNALAYTVGRHVVFGAAGYSPSTMR